MFNLLEKLRTQTSRSQRTFIAFTVSLLFTGLLFVFWLIKIKEVGITEAPVEKNEYTYTLTDTLVKNIEQTWDTLVQGASNLQESVKNIDLSPTVEYNNSSSTTTN